LRPLVELERKDEARKWVAKIAEQKDAEQKAAEQKASEQKEADAKKQEDSSKPKPTRNTNAGSNGRY